MIEIVDMGQLVWFEVQIPIKTVSEANCSEHWTKKSKRKQQQQFFVRMAMKEHIDKIRLPCTITLTRLSPRKLDSKDNLPMSFKSVSDELAALIFPEKVQTYRNASGKRVSNKGHCDSSDQIKWRYEQEKAKKQAIKINVRMENDSQLQIIEAIGKELREREDKIITEMMKNELD